MFELRIGLTITPSLTAFVFSLVQVQKKRSTNHELAELNSWPGWLHLIGVTMVHGTVCIPPPVIFLEEETSNATTRQGEELKYVGEECQAAKEARSGGCGASHRNPLSCGSRCSGGNLATSLPLTSAVIS